MTQTAVPVVDLARFEGGDADERRALAASFDRTCRDTGFFTLVGHGVDAALLARTRQAAAAFFALPPADKLAVERPPQKISRGYFRLADRSLAYTLGAAAPPDLHESFAFGRDDVSGHDWRADDPRTAMLAANLWPARPEGFRDTMTAYYAAMELLGARVARLMAAALGLEADFFADKFDRHTGVARLIRYPAQPAAPKPGQLRAGAHTDYGMVTFVRGDDVPGGLQIKLRRGGWIDVAPPPGGFVCNIADAMARWTNDRWISTLHRVANPPAGSGGRERISLVFFHMPNHDAEIRCLPGCAGADGAKYPPVTFADHYLGKLMKAAHVRLDAGVGDAAARPPAP